MDNGTLDEVGVIILVGVGILVGLILLAEALAVGVRVALAEVDDSIMVGVNTVIEDDLLMAKMDSGLIIQVIINIINNAIKYTPKDSIITITSKRKNNMAVIEISDNGKGINEESKEKLFDMFFTDNNKFGDGRRGLGLGLALCKSIIDAHEGCIYVRDNKPNGAIFGFTLHIEEVKINE